MVDRPYNVADLAYIASKADAINAAAAVLGVRSTAIAGAIIEEMDNTRLVVEAPFSSGDNFIRTFVAPTIREYFNVHGKIYAAEFGDGLHGPALAGGPRTHQDFVSAYEETKTLDTATLIKPTNLARLAYTGLNDIGVGKIQVRTAIDQLIKYNELFPDTDPLNLKQYNGNYDRLIRDISNPDSNATVAIAGLVIREAKLFYEDKVDPSLLAQYNPYALDAIQVSYYNFGRERMLQTAEYQGSEYLPLASVARMERSEIRESGIFPGLRAPRFIRATGLLHSGLTGGFSE